jgi:hypothetical protein
VEVEAMSITSRTGDADRRADMDALGVDEDDLFTQDNVATFPTAEEKEKKSKEKKAIEDKARHLAQMHGGEVNDWIRDLTPHGKRFSEERALQLGFERVDTHTYTSPKGWVLYQTLRYHHSQIPKEKRMAVRRPAVSKCLSGEKLNPMNRL